jgi:aminoglycoside phosphotransferase (APT) family kinase protein
MLGQIHAFRPDERARPREYQSWAFEAKRVVPDWANQAELWREAFALLAGGPPAYEPVFLHRDFHLGNVLWEDTTVTGVVDWVETSWARLDAAHCRTYLAMLHGPAYAGPVRRDR